MTVSAVTALLAMTTGTAFAADKEGVYVTVGGTLLSTELDLTDLEFEGQTFDFGTEDLDVTMINGRIGYRLNNYFAVEGELGFGLGGDEVDRTFNLTDNDGIRADYTRLDETNIISLAYSRRF